MKLSDFNYTLPPELIAQQPTEKRGHSRLLVVHRETGKIEHSYFYNLPDFLDNNTVLVRNNTKVFKARLFGKFGQDTNESEVFLLQKTGTNLWQCLTHPGRKFYPNKTIFILPANKNAVPSQKILQGTVQSILEDGSRIIQFNQEVEPLLDMYGHVPLPPYIKKEVQNLDPYQTVYAKKNGSVAAPTAGLHFTKDILETVKNKGIHIEEITLHVGLGTFQPVKTENIEDHIMHKEIFSLPKDTADNLNQAKKEGKKILAVGTTSNRVLEYCSVETPRRGVSSLLIPQSGHTDLFIYPGYKFKFVDMLLTNFHLPKSTLLMLVSAFAGTELIKKAYEEAIKEKYRFYSFGDAMLII